MVSLKGEDLLLQPASEDVTRYHRLRMSIPARLWSWQTVASWKWTGDREHINSLELRGRFDILKVEVGKTQEGPNQVCSIYLIRLLGCMPSVEGGLAPEDSDVPFFASTHCFWQPVRRGCGLMSTQSKIQRMRLVGAR